MANSDNSDERARGEASPRETRDEREKPRAELPEWLAKELFKIFV